MIAEKPQFLHLLWIVLILVFLYFYRRWREDKLQGSSGNGILLERQLVGKIKYLIVFHFVLRILILVCLIIALVNPQKPGIGKQAANQKGAAEFVFAIDVSRSMLAEDIRPSRLMRTQALLTDILPHFESREVGLVVFAGNAYPLAPLSNDHSFFKSAIGQLSPALVSRQGTSFADALKLSASCFSSSIDVETNIIIVSDGEDHENKFKPLLDSLRKTGIRFFCIGAGTPEGALIPYKDAEGRISYKTNGKGEKVITRLNSTSLQAIAGEGNRYINLSETEKFPRFLDKIIGVRTSNTQQNNSENYPGNLLIAAFIFLLLEMMIPAGWRKGVGND